MDGSMEENYSSGPTNGPRSQSHTSCPTCLIYVEAKISGPLHPAHSGRIKPHKERQT